MSIIFILALFIGTIGIVFDSIPVGVCFIIALIVFLYCLLTAIQSGLSEAGIICFIVSILDLIASSAYLFYGLDVIAIIGLR